MIRLARSGGDKALLIEALLWETFSFIGGSADAGQQAARAEAQTIADELQNPACSALCELGDAICEATAGHLIEALARVRACKKPLQACRNPTLMLIKLHDVLIYVCLVLMMLDEALAAAEEMESLSRSIGSTHCMRRAQVLCLACRYDRAWARYIGLPAHPADDADHREIIRLGRSCLAQWAGQTGGRDPVSVWFFVTHSLFLTGREEEARQMCLPQPPEGFAAMARRSPEMWGDLALIADGPEKALQVLLPLVGQAGEWRIDRRLDLWRTLTFAHERLGDHRSALAAIRKWMHLSAQRQLVSAQAQAALLNLELQSEREKRDAQRALIHAGKLAAVGRLASSVAHEISQPAAALMLLCDELGEHVASGRSDLLQTSLDDSKAQVARLAGLVSRMKQFSRDDPLRIERLNLQSVVEEALRLCRPAAKAAGIACAADVPMLQVHADHDRVILALVNLINNAIDAMRGQTQPPPKVHLEAEALDAQDVCLSVVDNGPGIPPDVLRRMGSAFFTTKASGLGLGLTITREALGSMGARLEFANESPTGARLSIYMPQWRT